MKLCPRCDQPMLDAASRCVRCGHEIKEDYSRENRSLISVARRRGREGIAYSSFAQFSLEVWALLAILGIIVALGLSLIALFNGEWLRAFLGVMGAWGNFALYALLHRVADLGDD